MNLGTWWWIAAGLTVLAELLTGTFYLLMLALGMAAAAIAAHLGYGLTAQLLTAAVVGGGAVIGWHLRRPQRPGGTLTPGANPDVVLDIGGRVHVAQWQADGTARVQYRGASWTARHEAPAPAAHLPAGDYVIRAIDGSMLVLGGAAPAPARVE